MRDRGFALLIVAIALAALALIFAAAIGTTRQHLAATSAHLTRVKFAAALDGAITTVGYDLVTARTIEPQVLTRPQVIDIDGVPVMVSARPEAAKLDLNVASPTLVYRYLLASGLAKAEAQRITDEIVERRKLADADYARAHDMARTEPFEAVSEVFALKGVTDDIADCIAPDLTVFTGLADVDAASASDRVRAADGLPPKGASATSGAPAATAGRSVTAGEIFEVTASAHDEATGLSLSRQVVLRVTGNLRSPIWTLAVATPAPNPDEAQNACNRIQEPERTARLLSGDELH